MKIELLENDSRFAIISVKNNGKKYEVMFWGDDIKDAILKNPESFEQFIPDYEYWDDYGNSEKETSVDNVLSDIWLDDEVIEIYVKGLSKEELEGFRI